MNQGANMSTISKPFSRQSMSGYPPYGVGVHAA